MLKQSCIAAWSLRVKGTQPTAEPRDAETEPKDMLGVTLECGLAQSCSCPGHFRCESPKRNSLLSLISLGWAGFSLICKRENSDLL